MEYPPTDGHGRPVTVWQEPDAVMGWDRLGPAPIGESWAARWRWPGLDDSEREWQRLARERARHRAQAIVGLGAALVGLAAVLVVRHRRARVTPH